ncbi:MAG: hypothetical protein M3P30_12275 [Chloroflexota bacterium]|nr:hypothetical protein [Chloroflexota bacterium]
MKPTPEIANFEDASTVRWLTATLLPARHRIENVPSVEVIDRIRDRVFAEGAPRAARSIAA